MLDPFRPPPPRPIQIWLKPIKIFAEEFTDFAKREWKYVGFINSQIHRLYKKWVGYLGFCTSTSFVIRCINSPIHHLEIRQSQFCAPKSNRVHNFDSVPADLVTVKYWILVKHNSTACTFVVGVRVQMSRTWTLWIRHVHWTSALWT